MDRARRVGRRARRHPFDLGLHRSARGLPGLGALRAASGQQLPHRRVELGQDLPARSRSPGIPITPTQWLAPGLALGELGYDEFVVKPSVGAGSRGAGRFRAVHAAAAREHVAGAARRRPHRAGAALSGRRRRHGEAGLVYLDGTFSHAVPRVRCCRRAQRTARMRTRLYVEERMAARTASDAERSVADAALAVVQDHFGTPLYARIDLLPSPDGPVVVEVELTEPSLFLSHHSALSSASPRRSPRGHEQRGPTSAGRPRA